MKEEQKMDKEGRDKEKEEMESWNSGRYIQQNGRGKGDVVDDGEE